MTKQSEARASRDVTSEDLALFDQAIADHEKFQTHLYVVRHILGEVGKVDAKRADLNRGVAAEQQLLDDLHKQTEAAQQKVKDVEQQLVLKQRELAGVEATIQERNVVLNQLNEGYNNLRRMLEAA
jgi:chromosome segregation ATPase